MASTLRVESVPGTAGPAVRLSADQFNSNNRLRSPVIPYAGGPLRLTCRLKADGIISRDVDSWERGMIIVEYFDENKHNITYQGWSYNDSFGFLIGSCPWMDFQKTVDIPFKGTGVKYLQIDLCLYNAKGSLLVEGLSLNRLPSTGMETPASVLPARVRARMDTYNDLVSRLGSLVATAEAKGIECRDARVSLTMGKCFQPYIDDDIAAAQAGPPAADEIQKIMAKGQLVLKGFPQNAEFLRINHQYVDPDPIHLAEREVEDGIRVCQAAIRELEARLSTGAPRQPAPSAQEAVLRVSDGEFRNPAGTPVFLFGFNFDSGTIDPKVRQALSANTCGGFFGGGMAGNYLDRTKEAPIPAQTDFMIKAMNDHPGMAADFLFLIWQDSNIPQWMKTWKDSATATGNHFSIIDPDNPASLRIDEQIYRQAATALAPHNGTTVPLVLYDLANEPGFTSLSPLTLQKFHQWLRVQYSQNLPALNQAYGKAYKDFESVPRDLQGAPAQRYDWLAFNQERVTSLFMNERKAIKSADPKSAVYIKLMPNYWEVRDLIEADPKGGINYEKLEPVQDVMGIDTTVREADGDFGMKFQAQGMACDFFKSIAPGKPILDCEWHGINGRPDPNAPSHLLPVSPTYVSAAVWHGFLHGLRGMYAWYWSRYWQISLPDLEPAREFSHSLLTQPAALDALGRTWFNIQRLEEYVVPFAHASSPVRVFFSEPSRLLSATFQSEFTTAYEGVDFQDEAVRMVTDTQAARGLEGVKGILVPPCPFLGEGAYQSLLGYARKGGPMVVVGDATFGFNERGQARSTQALRSLANVKWLPSASREDYSREFGRLLDQANVVRPLRTGGLVESRTIRRDGRVVSYLLNLGTAQQEIALRWEKGMAPKRIRNLLTGQPLPAGRVKLAPLELLLLAGED
jgi:hypothetical protein